MTTRVEYRIIHATKKTIWCNYETLEQAKREFKAWAKPNDHIIVKVTINSKPKKPKFKSGWYSLNDDMEALYNQNCRIRSEYSPWIVLGPEGMNHPIFEELLEDDDSNSSPAFWKMNYLKK
jgi:hypothetical protein